MRRLPSSRLQQQRQRQRRLFSCSPSGRAPSPPIVNIDNATFYRDYPSSSTAQSQTSSSTNPPIFPGLSFSLPARGDEHWSIFSPSSLARTTFLQVLNGQYVSIPPTARSYPYLSSTEIQDDRLRSPQNAVKYVGFDAERGGLGGTSLKGAYLSARYESRKEETDFSLLDYLTGHTELNALERSKDDVDEALLERVIVDLKLGQLLDMPVGNLSNGQTRRARIAKTLMSRPELLLLDGPFMGLDPPTVNMLSSVLQALAEKSAPRMVLSLRPEDHIPDWISHMVFIDEKLRILTQGTKESVLNALMRKSSTSVQLRDNTNKLRRHATTETPGAPAKEQENIAQDSEAPVQLSRDGFPKQGPPAQPGETVVDMRGVRVSYGSKTVLGDWTQSSSHSPGLFWSVHRGQRWGVFGPNGSGKTTLLSLITSDHPQTYSLPIKLFGKSRLPAPGEVGISLFELQKRIGHSSPEVHTYFPKNLSLRRALQSAWADAPLSRPTLDEKAKRRIEGCLRWFAAELHPKSQSLLDEIESELQSDNGRRQQSLEQVRIAVTEGEGLEWADTTTFRDLSFSNQRLLLFLRAIVAGQELVILDEAFSGIDEVVRDKCLLFLSHGERFRLTTDRETGNKTLEPSIVESANAVTMTGLSDEQALLVISHSREDVPGCIREWICLPEPGEGRAARWGRLEGRWS
ncbi:hypothetical protein H2203_006134 [Taxawa tesnikishii (nom. ined.)]|nr:hypothetical protein H2203_006134 [Dothideales sp. JES 119]